MSLTRSTKNIRLTLLLLVLCVFCKTTDRHEHQASKSSSIINLLSEIADFSSAEYVEGFGYEIGDKIINDTLKWFVKKEYFNNPLEYVKSHSNKKTVFLCMDSLGMLINSSPSTIRIFINNRFDEFINTVQDLDNTNYPWTFLIEIHGNALRTEQGKRNLMILGEVLNRNFEDYREKLAINHFGLIFRELNTEQVIRVQKAISARIVLCFVSVKCDELIYPI